MIFDVEKKPEPVEEVVEVSEVNGTPKELSKFEELRELKALFDEGVLTQEEFDAEKKKILEKAD